MGERARGRAYPGLQVDAARVAELLNVHLAHVAIAVAGYELHVQDADDTPVGEGKQLLENPEGWGRQETSTSRKSMRPRPPATTYGVRAHEFKCEAPLEVRAGPLHERRGQDHDAAALSDSAWASETERSARGTSAGEPSMRATWTSARIEASWQEFAGARRDRPGSELAAVAGRAAGPAPARERRP